MMTAFRRSSTCFVVLLLLGLGEGMARPALAIDRKPDNPPACRDCCPEKGAKDSQSINAPCRRKPVGSALSFTEGTLSATYPVFTVQGVSEPTLQLVLTYHSFHADGSNFRANTVMGFGWTHSYNLYLTRYRMDVFKDGGDGLTRKFVRNPDGTYDSPEGTAETLVRHAADDTFDMRLKDGTAYHFAKLTPAPFLMPSPPYYVTRITDRNGRTTTLTYNSNSLLDRITDHYGRQARFTYNAQKKLATITDPLGRVTRLEYDAKGYDLVRIIDPLGHTVEYTYNVQHQIVQKKDKSGHRFVYEYNAAGKPVRVTDGHGQVLTALSNPTNWAIDLRTLLLFTKRRYLPSTTTETDGRGHTWRYAYNRDGFLTTVTAPNGSTTTYTYDPVTLNLASVTDANGHTTSYTYDTEGNRLTMTDALGHVTTSTYESVFNQMTSMTDPNGRVTTYAYDTRGNRLRETDPLGHTRAWTYDASGNALTETDKNGNVTTHAYDAFGNRIKTTDAVGQMTLMTYDAVGNLLSRTDAKGHTTTFVYDALDRLVRTMDPVGHVTETMYDGNGDRIQVTDRNGNSTSYAYDLRRRPVQTTDALGQMTTSTYDGNNNRTTFTDKNGHTTSFQYDVQNRLTQTTDALGNMISMTYDGVGNTLTETDANSHTTTSQYDALNRLVQKTDAEGNVTQIVYDMVGLTGCPECTGPTRGAPLVTEQIDAEGKVTYFKYDALDRLIIQIRKEGDTTDLIDASDAVTRYSYDPQGNRTKVTEPNGNMTTYVYDVLNRQIKMTNAAGDMTLTTYDPVSNVKTVTAPNLNVTTYIYDALDRVIQVDDEIGRVATYTYDAVGNRLTEKDGNSNGTTNTYDVIYRLTAVTDALGRTMHYDYDPVGNLVQLTDREGNGTTYLYDAINRRTQMIDALGNVTRYQYDGVGNLIRIIDANNHATNYSYDAINRRIKETYADGRMRVFTYDRVGNLKTRTDQKGQVTTYVYNDLYFLLKRDYPMSADDTMTYDLSGRMLTAERGGWLVTFTYDGANRVTQTIQNGKIISYIYDISGRMRTLTYPGGQTIKESTDARGRLDTIDDSASPPPIVIYTYDLGNRVVSRTYRNGTTAHYTYNANNWVLTLDHTIGVTRVAGFNHDFDHAGNKHFEQKLHDPGDSEAYQYDNLYRLIDFKVGTIVGSTVPVPTTQTQYALDGVGNWHMKIQDSISENRMHSVTNEITKIDTVPVLSDFNGNTSEDGQYRYDYDEENRLSKVTRKSDGRMVGQYQYDALSRRIVKIADPAPVSSLVETRYFYDDARIIEEQNLAMVTLATYVYGNYVDEVLTMDRGGQTSYYHQNSLWSVEAITDSTAAVVERYSYDAYGCTTITNGGGAPVPANPWGTPHSAIGNPYLFTGRQLDEETGLYFYRARYYDCEKGRFLQRDPLGYVDGMNLYAYVGNRPTMSLDPFGEGEAEDEAKMIAAAKEMIKILKDRKDEANAKKLERWVQGMENDPAFRAAWLRINTMKRNVEQWQKLMKEKSLSEHKAIMEVLRSSIIPKAVIERDIAVPNREQGRGMGGLPGMGLGVPLGGWAWPEQLVATSLQPPAPADNGEREGLLCSAAQVMQEPLIDRCECYSGAVLILCRNWKNCDVYRRQCTNFCVSKGYVGVCKSGLCP